MSLTDFVCQPSFKIMVRAVLFIVVLGTATIEWNNRTLRQLIFFQHRSFHFWSFSFFFIVLSYIDKLILYFIFGLENYNKNEDNKIYLFVLVVNESETVIWKFEKYVFFHLVDFVKFMGNVIETKTYIDASASTINMFVFISQRFIENY